MTSNIQITQKENKIKNNEFGKKDALSKIKALFILASSKIYYQLSPE